MSRWTGRRRPGWHTLHSEARRSAFGPTDVQVRRTDMRKLVATHGVTTFAFNTVILGAVVSMLVALR